MKASDGLPLYLVVASGCLLVLLVLWKLASRRGRRQYHAPLGVANGTFADNIHRRKHDLHRYIETLQKKLQVRQAQLKMHDHVEELLTARAAMEAQSYPSMVNDDDNDDDPTWAAILARGRELYGDAWDHGKDGAPPLKEQMQLHKTELLASATPRKDPDTKLKKTIARQNQAALLVQQQRTARDDARRHPMAVLPVAQSQWKSQRKRGGRSIEPEAAARKPKAGGTGWSRSNVNAPPPTAPTLGVPKLNLAVLREHS
ncbi:hypothetical protein SPRG_14013 [Saprolegnia parasitica CBS 223.65]|uniref:Uncharacterized protein n=1 Tax=Saprolegnia parasitica (strain CBS 223.65) TaxID=695850 RepID=A0A067BUH3_SAPPC|nr:hypothetical protein SPRG_14013 [Saprolegnia parasitica CBS 223.65]KDO20495.1 hypothetical protein SPRG_14013 [Saprolegnia parasitica CBS 223.65]|eukprot:XP_012208820.1 hypothetical protein SPRG_14013 [Saprolegnia parasitica CBS 223.65]